MKTGNIEARREITLVSQIASTCLPLMAYILFVLYMQHNRSFLCLRVAGVHGQNLGRSMAWQLIYFCTMEY